jgi:hypothetical protein
MKKVLIAAFVFASFAAANAQEVTKDSAAVSTTTSTSVSTSSVSAVQDGYTQIKAEELPEAVKKSLEAQDFKGWIINSAAYNKNEEKYEVELKNGADTKKVKFDKQGKKLED